MGSLKYILGYRDFSKLSEIKRFIELNMDLEGETLYAAKELLIFKTSRQKTWLLATNKRLFCVLDDIAKDTFEVRWFMNKESLIYNNELKLHLQINPNYKQNIGFINFGHSHKRWLYSKALFKNPRELKTKIHNLILEQMGNHAA